MNMNFMQLHLIPLLLVIAIFSCGLIALTIKENEPIVADSIIKPNGLKRFKIISNEIVSYNDAKESCEKNGMRLARPMTDAEFEEIVDFLDFEIIHNDCRYYCAFWLGSESSDDGYFTWESTNIKINIMRPIRSYILSNSDESMNECRYPIPCAVALRKAIFAQWDYKFLLYKTYQHLHYICEQTASMAYESTKNSTSDKINNNYQKNRMMVQEDEKDLIDPQKITDEKRVDVDFRDLMHRITYFHSHFG